MSCSPAQTTGRTLVVVGPLLLGLLLLSGCTTESYPEDLVYPVRTDPLVTGIPEKDPPHFDPPGAFPTLFYGLEETEKGKLLVDPTRISADERQQLAATLTNVFGTPAHPKVGGLDETAQKTLKLEEPVLHRGSQVYRAQCLHCHGLSGDGHGPTAPWVNPHPRDYRQGRFKFTSSSQAEGERKPRREDLLRTIRNGVEGTSMPPFLLFADDDVEALASYVIHLSLRGEVEAFVLEALAKKELDGSIADNVPGALGIFAKRWLDAENSVIEPGKYPEALTDPNNDKALMESIRRGFELFVKQGGEKGGTAGAGCIGCHTDFGRANTFKYDRWGIVVKPANLTLGMYRGGRRPIDLYWRIHSGINGVNMPAAGKKNPSDDSGLTSDQIWDLVNFLQALPYPGMLERLKQEHNIDIQ